MRDTIDESINPIHKHKPILIMLSLNLIHVFLCIFYTYPIVLIVEHCSRPNSAIAKAVVDSTMKAESSPRGGENERQTNILETNFKRQN